MCVHECVFVCSVCVCVCVCVSEYVAVWCSGCVLGSGPQVPEFKPNFHLIFHLPPTSPTSPTSDYTLQFANLVLSYVAKWGVILWMIARRFEILCLVMIINLMDDLLNPLRNIANFMTSIFCSLEERNVSKPCIFKSVCCVVCVCVCVCVAVWCSGCVLGSGPQVPEFKPNSGIFSIWFSIFLPAPPVQLWLGTWHLLGCKFKAFSHEQQWSRWDFGCPHHLLWGKACSPASS